VFTGKVGFSFVGETDCPKLFLSVHVRFAPMFGKIDPKFHQGLGELHYFTLLPEEGKNIVNPMKNIYLIERPN